MDTTQDIPTRQTFDLTPIQVRVLGALIEKKETTPDLYPLTVNSLRNACNQKTARYPVTSYSEGEVGHTLRELQQLDLVREVWGARVSKYEHRADKVWKQMNREDIAVARCTVERLMKELGLEGVTRGRRFKVTTRSDDSGPRPLDLVDRKVVEPQEAYMKSVEKTTLLTALILYRVGTGPVQGFAVTLALGIVASFFSAVFVTRTLFLIYLSRKRPTEPISI